MTTIHHAHGKPVDVVGTDDSGNPGTSVFNRFALGGSFAFLIMQAILGMSQSMTNKTSLDAGLSQILAQADATYMNNAQASLQDYFNTNLAPYLPGGADANASDASTNVGEFEAEYNTMQSNFQAQEQQMKTVTSSVANTVSADNTNSSDFYQFATTAVQLLGYGVQMLQHSMGS